MGVHVENKTGFSKDTRVFLDGKDITADLKAVKITIEAGDRTRVLIECCEATLDVTGDRAPTKDNWQRFPDGSLKPFLTPHQYAELRDDDRFLYNCGPKPEGLV